VASLVFLIAFVFIFLASLMLYLFLVSAYSIRLFTIICVFNPCPG